MYITNNLYRKQNKTKPGLGGDRTQWSLHLCIMFMSRDARSAQEEKNLHRYKRGYGKKFY